MNAELQRFVRESLTRGLGRDAIRQRLLEAGWRPDEVDAALRAYAEIDFPVPVPRRRPYLSAREAFLYLVLFATLYASAFNVGQILFAMIERWVPDALQRDDYAWDRFGSWVRGATAGLIIAFPIYLALSRVIGREVAREPDKRGSPIRKWLTYITLFLAALVIIGDLTVFVTRLLGGELAPRFMLKVLVVLLIAAAVFGHYLADLRREEQAAAAAPGPSLGARAAAAAVFAVVLLGLFFSGSPRQARWEQLDRQRVDALRRISSVVQAYHLERGALPPTLETLYELPDGLDASVIHDPESNQRYEYQPIDSVTYELCAGFRTADTIAVQAQGVARRPGSGFWAHPAGRKCFRFVIPRRPTPVSPPLR